MSTVSLCLIARDEAEFLAECLQSAHGAVQEMIVVDTGSTDATAELARAAGARVVQHAWADDFAAARNAALPHVTGDWVLVLDADERLGPGAAAAIAAIIGRRDFDCGVLPLHNAASRQATLADVVSGKARAGDVVWLPRLLRRTADLRWEGVVHENVARWLVAHGTRVRKVDAPIVHLGALPDVREARQKGQRNVRLLEQRCAKERDDLTARGYLAHELFIAEDRERARQVADEGWSLRARSPKHVSLLRLGVTRALLYLERGDVDEALLTLAEVERVDGPQADVAYLRGHAFEIEAERSRGARRARLAAAAEDAYRQAVAFKDRPALERMITGAASWAAWTRLGTLALLRDDGSAAATAFSHVLADQPSSVEGRLGRAEAALLQGDVGGAFQAASALLELRPDGWVIAAACALEAGAVADARQFANAALARRAAGFASKRREGLLEQVVLELGLLDGRPVAGRGGIGLLGALSARSTVPPPLVAPTARQVERVLGNLLRQETLGPVGAWLEPRAEALAPSLPGLVRQALGKLGLVAEEDGSLRWPIVVTGPSEAAVKLVARLLQAHPVLAGQRAVHVDGGAVEGPRREVLVAEGTAAGAPDVVLSYPQLLDAPVPTLERLFAQLGYAASEEALRTFIEQYPGRPSASERRTAA